MNERNRWLMEYVQTSPLGKQAIRKRIGITCNIPTSFAQLQKTLKLQLGTSIRGGLGLKTGGIWDGWT
jgi:hypothetical protein